MIFCTGPTWDQLLPAHGGGAALLDAAAYGATGDGATDDAPALQRAVDAAAAAGRAVFLPKGVYRLSASLNLTRGCAGLVGIAAPDSVVDVPGGHGSNGFAYRYTCIVAAAMYFCNL